MGYDDYSYGQVYAAWQAELREQAAIDALARRVRRERRAERRAGAPGFSLVCWLQRVRHAELARNPEISSQQSRDRAGATKDVS